MLLYRSEPQAEAAEHAPPGAYVREYREAKKAAADAPLALRDEEELAVMLALFRADAASRHRPAQVRARGRALTELRLWVDELRRPAAGGGPSAFARLHDLLLAARLVAACRGHAGHYAWAVEAAGDASWAGRPAGEPTAEDLRAGAYVSDLVAVVERVA
jgi:hypothetical protein